ncbi:MAG TPA: bifunctional methylenetetrahydrofolate dehydrogenase/methenyltetrahydrofolate cyclohydrolase FolD [bacterium]|nr:bifunctional methylenetetrahydrofolate dehydrogenase/methenyltetrahydrofolate cyclohydrolase FolD [bacterium]
MKVVLDGKKTSQDILEEIKKESINLGITPGLCVIMVGDDPASSVYVKNKEKACEKVGFYHKTYRLMSDTTQDQLLSVIEEVKQDCNIHGLIVQLPLPKHINEELILNSIPVDKDVDCFHPFNVGNILTKKKTDAPLSIAPCTPAGVMELLERYNIDPAGKRAVIVGRSNIVGKPLALMLLNRDATVTICHSRTKDLAAVVKEADIVVAAVGVAKLVTANMVKEGAVVIDVGVNRMSDGKLCGDVDYETVKDKASAITPVPGGVGPMTIAMLLKNTFNMAKKQKFCK